MVKKIPLLKYRMKHKILNSLISNKALSNKNEEHTQKKHNSKKENTKPKGLCIKDHYYTFQQRIELFTLLYTTVVFKWIHTDRLLIIVDDTKLGYHIELFLKHFKLNSTFIDREMPVNTNKHYTSQFLKGVYPICIVSSFFFDNSPNFALEILDSTPIPTSIIYFDVINRELLENHCTHVNTKAIYHFISIDNKENFFKSYINVNTELQFDEFKYELDQVAHLRYRCEDIYHSIHKSDIKKAKVRKINLELLQSKQMTDYFKSNPEEKLKIIRSIEENTVKINKPSASFLPAYLVHENQNPIASAIKENYGKKQGRRRESRGKMEKYLEALDKNDGTASQIKF